MPQTGNTRFNLAAYMKARKEARDKQVFKNRNLAKELKRIERLEKKVLKSFSCLCPKIKYIIIVILSDHLTN